MNTVPFNLQISKQFFSNAAVVCAIGLFSVSEVMAQGTLIVPFGRNKELAPAHETYQFPYRENYIMLPLTSGTITEDGGTKVIVNKPVKINSKRPTVIPLGNGAPNVSPTPVVPHGFNGGSVYVPAYRQPLPPGTTVHYSTSSVQAYPSAGQVTRVPMQASVPAVSVPQYVQGESAVSPAQVQSAPSVLVPQQAEGTASVNPYVPESASTPSTAPQTGSGSSYTSPESGSGSSYTSPESGSGSSYTNPESGSGSSYTSPESGSGSSYTSPETGSGSSYTSPESGSGSSYTSPETGSGSSYTSPETGSGSSYTSPESGSGSSYTSPESGSNSNPYVSPDTSAVSPSQMDTSSADGGIPSLENAPAPAQSAWRTPSNSPSSSPHDAGNSNSPIVFTRTPQGSNSNSPAPANSGYSGSPSSAGSSAPIRQEVQIAKPQSPTWDSSAAGEASVSVPTQPSQEEWRTVEVRPRRRSSSYQNETRNSAQEYVPVQPPVSYPPAVPQETREEIPSQLPPPSDSRPENSNGPIGPAQEENSGRKV